MIYTVEYKEKDKQLKFEIDVIDIDNVDNVIRNEVNEFGGNYDKRSYVGVKRIEQSQSKQQRFNFVKGVL